MPASTPSSSAACRWWWRCTARWSAAGWSWPRPATSAWPTASAYYGLPEGQRGIFVGGGGSVRIPRLIGVARMTDLMMTGRVYDADEGLAVGLSQYVVAEGQACPRRWRWPQRIAQNAPMSNFAVMHALPRIADQPPERRPVHRIADGRRGRKHARGQDRLRAFLEGRAGKVVKGGIMNSPSTATPGRRLRRGHGRDAPDGTVIVRSTEALRWFPDRLTDCLQQWATEAPTAPSPPAAAPAATGAPSPTAQMLHRVQAVGQALLDLGLSVDRPLAILSGNDLEHLTLALAAMWAGVPYVPISTAYSLVSQDHGKLRHILAHH
jgi:hypothetical protein